MEQAWVSQWAMWTWAVLFGVMLAFEIVTLVINRINRAKGNPQRLNLTAYIRAFFGFGDRKLKHKWPGWVMALIFFYFLLHFMDLVP